jgi:quercetin dioxygenase-like cupin family protein
MNWIDLAWFTALLPMLTLSVPARAQNDIDSVKVDPAHHQVVFENDQVCVVRWMIQAGDKTLNHSHPNNLNINLTDYNGRVTTPDGKTFDVHAKAGSVSWRHAGVHVVQNIGNQTMEGIIVEPRKPASARPAGSADPVVVDPDHQKVEFENEQIRVIREHYPPGAKIPMHGHPDNVQVLLADMNVELTTPDGKTTTVMGKAGDVRWRVASEHSGQVLDKPLEQILIEMKGAPVPRTGGN